MVFLGIQLALSLIAAIAAIFAFLWAHRAAREGMAMRSLLERLDHRERALAAVTRISTEIDDDPETSFFLSESYLEELEAVAARTGRTLDELVELMIERALDKLDREPERIGELQAILRRLQALDDEDEEDDSEIREREASDEQ